MAFMMPVMKNNYDIYKCSRSRRTSEGSSQSQLQSQRSRKVSETKSECAGPRASSCALGAAPAHRSVPAMMGAAGAGAGGGRAPRPQRALSVPPGRAPAPAPAPAPHKLHARLVDKLKRTLLRKGAGPADDERAS